MSECKRCGRCCMHMHSDDTGMPCESLLIEDGIATCLINDMKPDVCKGYPDHPDFGGEPCFFNRGIVQYQKKVRREMSKEQEVIELLEKAKNVGHVCTWAERCKLINQAIALLKPCEACGGKGALFAPTKWTGGMCVTISCPACQEPAEKPAKPEKISMAVAVDDCDISAEKPASEKEAIELDKMSVSEIIAKYESSHNAITVLKRKLREAYESDDWMKKAIEFYQDGGCPICFSTDEAGCTERCYLGQLQRRLDEYLRKE